MSAVRWWMAVGAAVCCFGCALGAEAQFVRNLALNRPVTVTSSYGGSHPRLVDEDLEGSDWGWHFAEPYGIPPVPSEASPYFGAVDLAGAGNTVKVRTVRIVGARDNGNPAAWTLQSRDSAADPLDALVDSGWTDTGYSGGGAYWGLVHTFASPIQTRALRFRITAMTASNDRIRELQVFDTDPHSVSYNAIHGQDPALSREDDVPITTAISLDRLRNDTIDGLPPGGVPTIDKNWGDPDARSVMNYDYSLDKNISIDGARFYYQSGAGNLNGTLELQTGGSGAWTTVANGSNTANNGLVTFDFSAAPIMTRALRLKHTAIDIGGNPRSGLYAYEIELYYTVRHEGTLIIVR